jgi:tetratricopeptide (TPR) repeat protein/TolB-like protein
MGSNGSNKGKDEHRERLLEEIRRRAEEAELKRIEEEDRSSGGSPDHPHEVEAASPFPTLQPLFPSSPTYEAEKEQRGMVLRERLSIALDRRNIENARELLAELENLDPSDPALNEFRNRLQRFAAEPPEPLPGATIPVGAPPAPGAGPSDAELPPETVSPFTGFAPPPDLAPPPDMTLPPAEAPPPEPAPIEVSGPDVTYPIYTQPSAETAEDVASLYEAAVSLYEQEKYEKALYKLDQLLLKDRGNDDALALHQQVERAWRLAEVIKKEEAQHRAEEPPPIPVEQPVIPQGGKDSDFWGPTEVPAATEGPTVVPDTSAPARRPQIPLSDRVVNKVTDRVSKVHVPVKPILIGIGIVAALLIGYMIVNAILTAIVPPDRVLCVFPPSVTEAAPGTAGLIDAFADDLIRDLGSVHAIHVVASPTAFATRQRSTRPLRMAQSLGAGHFVVWSLAVRNNALSGTVMVMDTIHAQPVLRTALESSFADLPGHRRDLARKILEAMEVDIAGTDTPLDRRLPASSNAGYLSYLQGRAALLAGAGESLSVAMTAFEQAVREDSLDGDAWAALGWVQALSRERTFVPVRADLPLVLASVERAVRLGSRKAETFRTWGVVELLNGDYAKAQLRLEEAIATSPSDGEALRRLAVVQTARGLTDDALQTARSAVAIDPLNAGSRVTAGLIHQFRGEYAEAEAQYRRAVAEDRADVVAAELHAEVLVYLQRADDALANVTDMAARFRTDPGVHYQLGRIAQTGGRPKAEWTSAFEHSRSLLEEQLRARPDSALALSQYALTLTRLGSFRDAAAAQQRALSLAPADYRILYNAARMYALQRDKQKAMTHLAQAIDLRYDLRRILDMDLFNLRTDEDFLRSAKR